MSESKEKKDKGLKTPEEMKATGKKTGKIAKLTFQANGKYHQKGEEILGVSDADMKILVEQGLVE